MSPPSPSLLAGSLGRGLRTGSVDRPASAGVEGHVLPENGLATLCADLAIIDRAPRRASPIGAKQLCKETHHPPSQRVATHHRGMWPDLKAPDPLSVETAVFDGASGTATFSLDFERHNYLSRAGKQSRWNQLGAGPTQRCCGGPALAARCSVAFGSATDQVSCRYRERKEDALAACPDCSKRWIERAEGI